MTRIRNKLIKILLPIVVLLLSGACSIHYYVPVDTVASEDRFAVIRTDSLAIVLRPQSWNGSYSELNNRFFPVFIRIMNTGNNRIKLNEDSFSILANGMQYDPIPLEFLLANLRDSILLKNYNDPFGTTTTDLSLTNINKEQEFYYEVLNNTLSFGDLLPGGTKEGYLFYNRSVSASSSWTIDVMGQSIGFIRK